MSITKKGVKWELKNSIWILWSFILFFNGIGMFYAGIKVKVKRWHRYGLIYIAIMWISFFMVGKEQSYFSYAMTLLFSISYPVCIVHTILIRSEYLLKLEELEDNETQQTEADVLRKKIIGSSSTINKDNIPPEKLKIPPIPKMVDIPKIEEERGAIDINSCNESELADLPGVGLILAKKALKLRNDNNGFTSVDEFIQKLSIKPHYAEKLKVKICCLTTKNIKYETAKIRGREEKPSRPKHLSGSSFHSTDSIIYDIQNLNNSELFPNTCFDIANDGIAIDNGDDINSDDYDNNDDKSYYDEDCTDTEDTNDDDGNWDSSDSD